MNLTSKSKNEEILNVYENQINAGIPVVFAVEKPANGKNDSRNIFVIQKVEIKGLENEENVPLSLSTRIGDKDRIVRAVTNVPANHPICKIGANPNIHIKIVRTVGELDRNEYPTSQAVINPVSGEVTTRDGLPVFEHKVVMAGKSNGAQNIFMKGETGTMTKLDAMTYVVDNCGQTKEIAQKICQLSNLGVTA